jgi:endoglucanase
VIIDWHKEHRVEAPTNETEAVAFFTQMATTYGAYPNVIFEIYNEPNGPQWPAVKAYAEIVIGAIRKTGSTNLIVVGTPSWSRDVDIAAVDPITDFKNIAYTLHFYAGSHRQCHRAVENRPLAGTSKPATLRCFIHIRFFDSSKGLFNFLISGVALVYQFQLARSPSWHRLQIR